jgi:hypothetical protein
MDRRQDMRLRTLKRARIVFNDHHSVIDCTVRNLSPAGACLQVASPIGIPERFEVRFEGGAMRRCRQVWYRNGLMGVRFL